MVEIQATISVTLDSGCGFGWTCHEQKLSSNVLL